MFDVGFWELVVIGIVALIVIGPERLPGVARTAGLWLGRLRRFVAGVKADIEREVKAEELKRIMEEQAKSSGLHELMEETRAAADDLNRTVTEQTIAPPPASTASLASQPGEAPAEAQPSSDATPSQERHG
ncbi:MAG: Sec-independent protein translocase protein TatB [Gammaproteobacteria bacterium]|nr:Sec-independent protein translocase protein TatB [Gammaproteobacteria bacterium]